ncbi:MAG TPA: AAA family ATPase [Thermoanaerobaculia bacterium]
MKQFVVVSGLPASGKTTIATGLAAELELPLLDKDAYLEALLQHAGIGDLEWRHRLSRLADEQLRSAASTRSAAVLASWWRHPKSNAETGTPTDWLNPTSDVIVEVHCVCRPSVAAARFLARSRHPGHLDGRWSLERLLPILEEQQSHGPLFPRQAILVDTEQPVEMQTLAQAVKAALHEIDDA